MNSKRTSVGGFTLIQTLDNAISTASMTNFNGQPAYLLAQTTQPTCTDDEAGWAGGVKSGTVGKEVKPTSGSETIIVEGKQLVRKGDTCTMNNANTTGKYVFGGFSAFDKVKASILKFGIASTANASNVLTAAKIVESAIFSRSPTEGEVQMLKDTFGEEAFGTLNLTNFRIHKADLVNDRSVVINGEIYFDDTYYKDDFSKKQNGYSLDYDPKQGALFIHESTHVWQYQLGHLNVANGLYLQGNYELYMSTNSERGFNPYKYETHINGKFDDYNMEQQGDILADYYVLSLRNPNKNYSGLSQTVEDLFDSGYTYEQVKQIYKNVLKDFIKEPNDRGNLPTWF